MVGRLSAESVDEQPDRPSDRPRMDRDASSDFLFMRRA
jgi:hypothetical protein